MVDKLRLTVLAEDSVRNSQVKKLMAIHGLSILLKAETGDTNIHILMDTGQSSEILLKNADALDVNLRKVDVIVLSHGHYDHTDGLMGALKGIGKQVPVIAHPKAFNVKFVTDPKLRFIGANFTIDDIERNGGKLFLVKTPLKIAEDIIVTGEIERVTDYEKVEDFWTIEENKVVKDFMPDDQALIISLKDKGLVVITGCAHAGIINTIYYAEKITRTNKIYGVLGGFHLLNASEERIEATIRDLAKINPEFLGPCHCTGEKAINKMKEKFGDKCHHLRTGDIIEL